MILRKVLGTLLRRTPLRRPWLLTRGFSTFNGRLSTSVLSTLPEHYLDDFRAMTDELLKSDLSKIIVLDDDPTETQKVHGVNAHFDFSVEAIAHELASKDSRVLYLLTNTRAMNPAE